MESYNMTEDKINQIMNAAAEEIAKYVDVCNEGGQLVMKVKDGVTTKGDTFNGIHYGSVKSDKDFLNPFGFTVNEIYIDTMPDKVVVGCTIPTSIKLSKRCKNHSAFCVLRDNPKAAVVRGKRGEDVPRSYQQFCNVVQEKINNMQANANSIQDEMTNDKILKEIMDATGKTTKKKKKKKKNTNQQEEPKVIDKREEQKVDEKQAEEEPKIKHELKKDHNINNDPTEKKVIEKKAKTVKQSKVVQRRPNYVKKTNIIEKKRKYDDHYLQEAKDYYTYQGTINPEKYYFWPQTPLNKNAKTFFPKNKDRIVNKC